MICFIHDGFFFFFFFFDKICVFVFSIHSAKKSGKREILIINQQHLMKYHKRYTCVNVTGDVLCVVL